MKSFVIFGLVIWLLCGIIGAVVLDHSDIELKSIVSGPITLVKAFNRAS